MVKKKIGLLYALSTKPENFEWRGILTIMPR